MKIARRVSVKVIAANRRNAAKSTGPKTGSGKKRVSHNALKHGVYARELYVLAEEKVDFETLRRELFLQLAPKTTLQNLAVEQIACCTWRCKLAARLETGYLRSFLNDIRNHEAQAPTSRDETVLTGWYGTNRQNLQSGIRFLSQLRNDVAANGRVREYFKDQLVSVFGAHFYNQLTVWTPVNLTAIHLADHLLSHAATFNAPLPDKTNGVKIVVDPRERLQMALKLIDQEARHLRDLEHSYEQRAATSRDGPTDFSPRFFTSATRDLQRAIDSFLHLKAHHL